MDKKGIFGVILAIVGLIVWQMHQSAKTRQYQAEKAAWDAKWAKVEAPTPAPGATAAPIEAAPAAPSATAVPETVEKLRTKSAEYAFTNIGGGLARLRLDEHIVDKRSKLNVVINEFGAIPIGAISDVPGEKTDAVFTAKTDAAANTITFDRVDERQLALSKKFTLPRFDGLKKAEALREEYLLNLDLTFTNRGAQPLAVPPYWLHLGSAAPIHPNDAEMFIGLNYLRGDAKFGIGENHFVNLTWFAEGGFLFWRHGAKRSYPETAEAMKDVRWAAVANQYFCTLATPQVDPKALSAEQVAQRGIGVWARRNAIPPEQWAKARQLPASSRQLHAIDGALQMSGFTLEPGASATRSFEVLAGPSEYRRLKQFDTQETEILDFGMFGWISKGLLSSLNWLQSWLGTYWAAICVLTVIIRSAMWPLQNRATATAKKMAALSPKLKEIQERYKDEPMRMQQETGKLWKQYGINPLGGCLPLLVQIPIFFGFYNMLNKAVELRNSGFLWVEDLSQPDTVAHLFGIPVNILPLVMAATMFVQMKLTPKAGDPMQQRIMMFMPLIFIALCYNYAAALALYWSVQNVFSIVQLYVTRDKLAAEPTPVEVIPPPSKSKKSKRRT